jgi:hypothetical protein
LSTHVHIVSVLLVAALALSNGSAANAAATFDVHVRGAHEPLVFVAYGDMRFTDGAETEATNPVARRALVAKVAAEHPSAIFVNGDVPYHGIAEDYAVFHRETLAWRTQHIRVFPALGNHELALCQVPACLERWWTAFPELEGRRWYSVALGTRVLTVVLDSTSSLLPGSEQRAWLDAQLQTLEPSVRVVLIVLHHPPVADLQTVKLVDHNVRPNEAALADALGEIAAHSAARFVVSAGHVHNYERLRKAGVTYLVSGGGGARPADIDRSPDDLFLNGEFPNYHYVRFELSADRLVGTMVRLADHGAAKPQEWQVRDRFEVSLSP